MNLKPLIDILAQEQKIHEKLLLAKRQERKLLAAMDAAQLLKNSESLSDLVEQARMCESKRMAMTYEIALKLDITQKDVTLRDILERLPSANRAELERAGDSLKNTLETIRSTNLSNHQLLRQSVESIRHELDEFAPTEESGVYTKKGARDESTVRRGGLNLRA